MYLFCRCNKNIFFETPNRHQPMYIIHKKITKKKGTVIPLQAQRVPEGWGSWISRQSAHEGGNVSPTHRPTLPPRKYPWYSFMLEAELTPGPYCGRKDYVNENFQWHHQELNLWPSGFWRCASTNCATGSHKYTWTRLRVSAIVILREKWVQKNMKLIQPICI